MQYAILNSRSQEMFIVEGLVRALVIDSIDISVVVKMLDKVD